MYNKLKCIAIAIPGCSFNSTGWLVAWSDCLPGTGRTIKRFHLAEMCASVGQGASAIALCFSFVQGPGGRSKNDNEPQRR